MGGASDESDERAELSSLVARLEREVAELRAELAELRSRREGSMAADRRCPVCGHRTILHATEVLDRSEAGRSKLALQQPSIWRAKGAGEFEVFVCTGCGRVEWRVKDLDSVAIDGDKYRLLEPDDDQGPYR
ncbi:MAG: hypothetical protein JRI23_19010 [Deltaproteobacteria bacterium]|jgi:predicted RNA-binding Zn-ribbon protein involved in translation (DUF1610 family)|nr:hypothetical protein [Deltaproteobacteria bacterium]MBW2533955.1 hypothetical protein [Deltaproteobacteria bacterium]